MISPSRRRVKIKKLPYIYNFYIMMSFKIYFVNNIIRGGGGVRKFIGEVLKISGEVQRTGAQLPAPPPKIRPC